MHSPSYAKLLCKQDGSMYALDATMPAVPVTKQLQVTRVWCSGGAPGVAVAEQHFLRILLRCVLVCQDVVGHDSHPRCR